MRQPLSPRQALLIAASIARALAAVHGAGVLHRDLKPGNIMLREDHSVALIDFGLSKDAALSMDITETGTIFGTPHYMSPEQGHAEAIDERSDLYSLGVILFEMLAGTQAVPRREPDGHRLQAPQGGHTAAAARLRRRAAASREVCSPSCRATASPMRRKPPRRSSALSSAGVRARRAPEAAGERAGCRGSAASILRSPTPQAWVEDAVANWPELLVDHANCEKKAASTALALMFAYPEDQPLVLGLSRLAREELRHYEQVVRVMAALGVPFARQRPGRYAQDLRALLVIERAGAQARPAAVWRADRGALGGALRAAGAAPAGSRWRRCTPAWRSPRRATSSCTSASRGPAPRRSGGAGSRNWRCARRSWRPAR